MRSSDGPGGGDDLLAHDRVLLHELPLLVAQRAGFGDDLVGDAELADVVQVAGLDDQADRLLVEADRAREQLDVAGDVVGVLAEVGVALGERGVQDRGDQFRGAAAAGRLLAVHVLVGESQRVRRIARFARDLDGAGGGGDGERGALFDERLASLQEQRVRIARRAR